MKIDEAFGFEQKKICVAGKEYTLQNIPLKAVYQMQERAKDKDGNMRPSIFYDEIFDKIILSPKVSWDDFSDVEELEELMTEVYSFLTRNRKRKMEGESEE
ncbi:hypothetical protein C3V36_07255 [Lachnospiraceae bacterium oral taxon 500]|nr:hypothetical protein C3V36_07255 [Lachnospiraceae bacterium oral taxon 500]